MTDNHGSLSQLYSIYYINKDIQTVNSQLFTILELIIFLPGPKDPLTLPPPIPLVVRVVTFVALLVE